MAAAAEILENFGKGLASVPSPEISSWEQKSSEVF
jgi:hypothetical protein